MLPRPPHHSLGGIAAAARPRWAPAAERSVMQDSGRRSYPLSGEEKTYERSERHARHAVRRLFTRRLGRDPHCLQYGEDTGAV